MVIFPFLAQVPILNKHESCFCSSAEPIWEGVMSEHITTFLQNDYYVAKVNSKSKYVMLIGIITLLVYHARICDIWSASSEAMWSKEIDMVFYTKRRYQKAKKALMYLYQF